MVCPKSTLLKSIVSGQLDSVVGNQRSTGFDYERKCTQYYAYFYIIHGERDILSDSGNEHG